MSIKIWHGSIFRTRHPGIFRWTLVFIVIIIYIDAFTNHKINFTPSELNLWPQLKVKHSIINVSDTQPTTVQYEWYLYEEARLSEVGFMGSGISSEVSGDELEVSELSKSNLNETDQVNVNPESGHPRIVILWTTWRSGSTFLGDLLVSAVPGTFYSYEPLIPYGVRIFRSEDSETSEALTYLSNLFRCDLTNYQQQVRRMAKERCYRRRNTYLMARCADLKVDCGKPDVVSSACRSAKFHFAKVLRMGLVWAKKLLDDPSLDLQIIYMVRDPRPVIRSRRPYQWCKSDCSNVTNVCHHLRRDLEDSRLLKTKYPDRFKFVQYEHLSLNTERYIRDIWNFLHLNITNTIIEKVRNLTSNKGPSGAFDTNRDTSAHTFSWRKSMDLSSVLKVQKECDDVISQLGLRSFYTATDLRNMTIPTLLSEEDAST